MRSTLTAAAIALALCAPARSSDIDQVARAYRGLTHFPGHLVGRWYLPYGEGGRQATSLAVPSGKAIFIPVVIPEPITITALASRVVTASASGNFGIAVYAASATTHLPTGPALGSVLGLSTGTASTTVTGAVSATLPKGLAFVAIQADNATATFAACNTDASEVGALLGSSSPSNILSASGTLPAGYSTSLTYGSWPDVTAATWVEYASPAPTIAYQVGSVLPQ